MYLLWYLNASRGEEAAVVAWLTDMLEANDPALLAAALGDIPRGHGDGLAKRGDSILSGHMFPIRAYLIRQTTIARDARSVSAPLFKLSTNLSIKYLQFVNYRYTSDR